MAIRDRESDVVRACLELLHLAHIPAIRLNAGLVPVGKRRVRLAPEGWPDVVGCLPPAPGWKVCRCGRFLGIECKRKNGRVRPAQRAWLASMMGLGAVCLLVSDVKELEAWLKEAGYL